MNANIAFSLQKLANAFSNSLESWTPQSWCYATHNGGKPNHLWSRIWSFLCMFVIWQITAKNYNFQSSTDIFKLSWFWEISNGNAYVIINGLGPIAIYQHNFEDEVEVEGCLSKGLSLVNQLPIHTSLYLETSWLLHQLALPIERNGLSVILP